MGKRIKIVRVPATTNNLTKGIINFLRAQGHFAFRVNTMGIPLEDGSGWKKSGSEKGVSDVLACMRPRSNFVDYLHDCTPGAGRFVGFEIKRGRDRVRKTQSDFRKNIESSGGVVIVVKTYADFLAWYTDSDFSIRLI